jgi:hypothetical protein
MRSLYSGTRNEGECPSEIIGSLNGPITSAVFGTSVIYYLFLLVVRAQSPRYEDT